MKINLNWLAEYVDLRVSFEELVESINIQLGEIESIEDLSLKYKAPIIVEVVSIKKHPHADNLSICLIDAGKSHPHIKRQANQLVQVVCGASNLTAGMLAVWLPPGSAVPSSLSTNQTVVLNSKKIRQIISEGMLASLSELDLGSDKTGILEIPTAKKQYVGQSFGDVYGLNTHVLDIENKMFTHRPDCFGLLGLAREISAITKSPFEKPDWYYIGKESNLSQSADNKLRLTIEDTNLCSQFRVRLIQNLTVQSSDLKFQFQLASVGIKPINNIVDWTNYFMYLTGQPSHAFDYDKLLQLSQSQDQSLNLIIRETKKGETLKLLNDKILRFNQPALVIATDKQPVALAGIMGGVESEVDQSTTKIVLEVANFNQYHLHRTSMRYGIFSEALTRFTKGQSLKQIMTVSNRLSSFIAGGNKQTKLLDTIYEVKSSYSDNPTINLKTQFINDRLGSNLTSQQISQLLQDVEFEVETHPSEALKIKAPFWRTDIAIAEDIVEEIGRLNGGYQTLKPVLPRRSLSPAQIDPLLSLKSKLRQILASRGANEVINYSFISKNLALSNQEDVRQAFELINPLNPQLEVYRQSLISSLVQAAEINLQSNHDNFALFEIGCVHQNKSDLVDQEGLPLDLPRLGLIYINKTQKLTDNFYTARHYLDLIANDLNIEIDYDVFDSADEYLYQNYQPKHLASLRINNNYLGLMGFINNQPAVGFEVDLKVLLEGYQKSQKVYTPISRFPKSTQDLTLQVETAITYRQLSQVINQVLNQYCQKGWKINLRFLDIFQSETTTNVKNISFRIEVNHSSKTPLKGEVSSIIKDIVLACQKTLKARQVI
ncbi:MAG: phenylalanine--tRNA ligase subunit beta [Candidatus Saccharibacteria bacterium]|nr:phenylalanine--tRNA ligase subunit beta [Candidatus Saccharibacteria bacterium]